METIWSSHPCTARGLICPRRMYAHHNLLARQMVGLDRATLEKEEKLAGGELEVIHMALECMNDQLRTIVKWPTRALANDTFVRHEFLRLLCEMPNLSSLDRALCQRQLMSHMDDMRDFVEMTDEERKGFRRVLLRDVSR